MKNAAEIHLCASALRNALSASARVRKAIHACVDSILHTAGLNTSQWLMLCHLRTRKGDSLSGTANSIGHDAGALSRALHPLCLRELVTSHRQPGDRRSVWIELTDSGRALCDQLEAAISTRVDSAVALRLSRSLVDLAAAMSDTAHSH
jgi:DNA-binding MarR family transcriptional regulator